MSELTKDKECIKCEKVFDCKGKPKGIACVNFEKRKDLLNGKKYNAR